MNSNIVNMADHNMDKEDKMLASLFAEEPIADDGFSDRVIKRIRFGIWVNRLALPTAAAVGAVIAAKPLGELIRLVPTLVPHLPMPAALDGLSIPSLSTIIVGAGLLVIGAFVVQMVDE